MITRHVKIRQVFVESWEWSKQRRIKACQTGSKNLREEEGLEELCCWSRCAAADTASKQARKQAGPAAEAACCETNVQKLIDRRTCANRLFASGITRSCCCCWKSSTFDDIVLLQKERNNTICREVRRQRGCLIMYSSLGAATATAILLVDLWQQAGFKLHFFFFGYCCCVFFALIGCYQYSCAAAASPPLLGKLLISRLVHGFKLGGIYGSNKSWSKDDAASWIFF